MTTIRDTRMRFYQWQATYPQVARAMAQSLLTEMQSIPMHERLHTLQQVISELPEPSASDFFLTKIRNSRDCKRLEKVLNKICNRTFSQNKAPISYEPEHGEDNAVKAPEKGTTPFLYYARDSFGERWIVKGNPIFQGEIPRFERVLTWEEIAKELFANQIYQFFVPSARLTAAVMPLIDAAGRSYLQILRESGYPVPKDCPCLLSRFLDHFQEYGYLPRLNDQADRSHFEVQIQGRLFPEMGLGKILAAAYWIRDKDVIGGTGANIGYRLRQNNDGLIIETCKIDPGNAFYGFENEEAKTLSREVQLSAMGPEELIQSKPENWPQRTREEFFATLQQIVSLTKEQIQDFFELDRDRILDAPESFSFSERFIEVLVARQEAIKNIYRQELLAYSSTSLLDIAPSSISGDSLVDRLLVRQKWLSSDPVLQQALRYYILPDCLPHPTASDKSRRTIKEVMQTFLDQPNSRILLLLGPAGAGKTLFTHSFTQELCQNPASHGLIPLRIELKRFTEETVGRCVYNTLVDDYGFTQRKISQLQRDCRVLIILEGFDEISGRPKINLYNSNQLQEWREGKFVITCRSQYYTPDMQPLFIPIGSAQTTCNESYIAPFTELQLDRYLSYFPDLQKEISAFLDTHPDVRQIINTPILLRLFVEAWSELKNHEKGKRLFQYDVYEAFFRAWYKKEEVRACQHLGHYETLTGSFAEFSQELAWEMFVHAVDEVHYEPEQVDPLWHRFFSDTEKEVCQARMGCPLTRSGNNYSLIHKSLADFLVAQRLWETLRQGSPDEKLRLWNTRLLRDERRIMEFLAEKVLEQRTIGRDSDDITQLFNLVLSSQNNPDNEIAASNAITALNFGGVPLSRRDLPGIRAPRADLSEALLDYTNLSGSNLNGALLAGASLRHTNLERASLQDIDLQAYPSWCMDGPISAVSPDGKWIFVNKNEIWNLETRTLQAVLDTTNTSSKIVFSPDGTKVATVCDEDTNTCLVWDRATGKLLANLKGNAVGSVNCMAISPDSKWIATGDEARCCTIWNLQNNSFQNSLGRFLMWKISAIAISPDGRWVATGEWNSGQIIFYDAISLNNLFSCKADNMICVIAISPDSKWFATGDERGNCQLWDIQTRQCLANLKGHTEKVTTIAISPDGKWFATVSWDGTCRLWDPQTHTLIRRLDAHSEMLIGVVISPDGERITTVSRCGTFRVWPSKRLLHLSLEESHQYNVDSICYSQDGTWFATSSVMDHECKLWDSQTLMCVGTLGERILGFSPDRQWIATSRGRHYKCKLWDSQTLLCAGKLQGEFLGFSPDGQWLVTATEQHICQLWSLPNREFIGEFNDNDNVDEFNHEDSVRRVAISPDCQWIVTESWNYYKLWNRKTFSCVWQKTNKTYRFNDIVVSSEGRCFIIADDGKCHILDEQTMDCISFSDTKIRCIAFSQDESWFATGHEKGTCQLWNSQTYEQLGTLKGHESTIALIEITPDDLWLITGSMDGTCQIWDRQTFSCLAVLQGHTSYITSIAISPDKCRIITGSGDKTFRVWQRQGDDFTFICQHVRGSHGLDATNCLLEGATGLSVDTQLLLEQEGAVPLVTVPAANTTLSPQIRSTTTASKPAPLPPSSDPSQPAEMPINNWTQGTVRRRKPQCPIS